MSGPVDVHDIAQMLESFTFAQPKPVSGRRKWLREQAAVVVYFDSDALTGGSDQGAPDNDLLDFLGEDCQRVTGTDDRAHWALLDSRRREVAAELGPAGLHTATTRKVLPVPDHPVQEAMDGWLGTLRRPRPNRLTPPWPNLNSLDRDGLRALQQIVLWFGAVDTGLPDPAVIERRIAVLELDQPLHELVDEHFRGRAQLLRELDRYAAGGHSPGANPPLVFWGPGGVGKSTVIAQFLLRQPRSFPFAYLNFDRAVLDPEQPRTALVEATRQLELRYPDQAALASHAQSVLLDEDYLGHHESTPWLGHIGAGPAPRTEPTDGALDAFADLANELTGGTGSLLLVLDTFEEVQRSGRHTVRALLDYLLPLRTRVPGFRLLIAGRSPVYAEPLVNMEIGDFDLESARGYLEARVPGLSRSETSRVLLRVGRNPLSLRLAAELLTRPGVDRKTAFLSLDRGHVQGILYQRILDHIRDEEVRRIAHPGLVLRRITPAVIADILAAPCDLTVTDSRRARQLFDALEAEATLVERRPEDDPDALWHRSDVRRLMLPALRRDDPDRVTAIHRRAVRFYQKQVGAVARAEELYHRMMLGQTLRTLERHWSNAAVPLLRGSFDELPPAAQVFLASHSGGDLSDLLDEEIRTNADMSTRESHIRNRVSRMLAASAVSDAYDLITKARTADGEPLVPDLEIQVREHAGDIAGALDLARRHLSQLSRAGAEREYVNTTLAVGRLLERMGEIDEATAVLEDLRWLLGRVGDETGLLQVNVTLLRLARTAGRDRARLVAETTAIAEQTGSYTLAQEPALLRALTAEVGDASDTLLAAGVRHIGLDLTAERNVPARLATALVAYDAAVSPNFGVAAGVVMKDLPPIDGDADPDTFPDQIAAAGSRSVSRSIAHSIDKFGPTNELRTTLVQFYREQDASARQIRG